VVKLVYQDGAAHFTFLSADSSKSVISAP